MRKLQNILITGGCGFIGSNFIRYLFNQKDFTGNIINIDKLTYAGNLDNLTDIEEKYSERYFFHKLDICNSEIFTIVQEYNIDTVVHFAAESHVDKSIAGPEQFIFTNIIGTFCLLEIFRIYWKDRKDVLFHHVSTDEVFGSLGTSGKFSEFTAYDPKSPYSASKASSDHLVRAYHHTYDIPVTISNCSNNYGPYQYPEKLIPLMILNLRDRKPLPVYGDGLNVRDWIHVEDHCSAIWAILKNGNKGSTYCIGGDNEWKNIDIVHTLCKIMANSVKRAILIEKDESYYTNLITFVEDRAGHDRRYAINSTKIKDTLGWRPEYSFNAGLINTVEWYLNNYAWIKKIIDTQNK